MDGGRKRKHRDQRRADRDADLAPTQRRAHARAAVIHVRHQGSAPSPAAWRFCLRHRSNEDQDLLNPFQSGFIFVDLCKEVAPIRALEPKKGTAGNFQPTRGGAAFLVNVGNPT